jgi:outer membrane receptor protein involved in Fe transport
MSMKQTQLGLACAAVFASHPAHAQPAAPAQDDKPVARIEVKGSADVIRRNDTAAKIVVMRDEIVKYGDASVLDVLKRQPGVTVDGESVRMRGLAGGYTQVLVNGERPPAGFSLETLAPDSIERIEIIRAATAEYSTQSVAGTVNIVLRKAAAKPSREFKLSTAAGAAPRVTSVNLAKSGKADKMNYTVGGVLARNESTTPSSGTSWASLGPVVTEERITSWIGHHAGKSGNLNSRVTWVLDGGDSLAWNTFVNAGRFGGHSEGVNETLAGPSFRYPNQALGYIIENASAKSDLNLVLKLRRGGKLDTRAGVFASRSERSLHRLGWDGSWRALSDWIYDTSVRDRGLTWTGKYSVPVSTSHAMALGWDAGGSRYGEGDFQVDTGPLPQAPLGFDTRFVSSMRRLALYVQDEWELTPRWSVYLGARWEGMKLETTGDEMAPSTSSYSVLSPIMQTLWKLPGTKGSQLRLALTRTYRAPELNRMVPRHFYTSTNTPTSPDYLGNPALGPELAAGIDTAFEQYFESGGMVSASASSREITDLIRNAVSFDGARWVSSPTNQGKAHVRTLELEAKLPVKAMLPGAPELELRASVSRNWSRVDEVPGPGNRLDRQPALSANLGADYSRGALRAGASFAMVKGGWTRSSAFESDYSSMRRDLEAYVLYKLDRQSQLRFTAINVLRPDNVRYARYQDGASAEGSNSFSPSYRGVRLQYEQKI